MDSIQFQFALNATDLFRGTRSFYIRSLRFRASMIALTILAFAAWIAGIEWGRSATNIALAFTVTILFAMAYRVLLLPWTFAQQASHDERVCSKSTWTFDTQSITISNIWNTTSLNWTDFSKVLETNSYFLFVYAGDRHQFQIVPKNAIPVELEVGFRELIVLPISQTLIAQAA